MIDFRQSLKDALKEESDGAAKYLTIAKEAPDADSRKQLLEIAKQEIMHKAILECILLDQGETVFK